MSGDGRYIDPGIGSLQGEGAQQTVSEREARLHEIAGEAFDRAPSQRDMHTYYDRPVLKTPVWKWYIGAYFVAGGVAGAAAVLGAAAQLLGGRDARRLVRKSRWIAAAGTTIGTGFLVADLGRPERFLNMLRVFRPTSPMSVGSWILAPATGAAAASVVLPGALGDAAGLAAGALGAPLAAYTAALTSNTAVPVWQATRRTLPALFTASAAAGAASLLGDSEPAVRTFGAVAQAVELAAGMAVDREASRVERVGAPLKNGVSGALWRSSKIATLLSLVLSLVSRRPLVRRLAAALGLAGSVGSKFAIFRAGFASGRDPRASFEQQRAGYGGAAVNR